MKHLLSSLKEKKRYLVYEAIDENINGEILIEIAKDVCNRFLGELGMAKAGVMFLEDNFDNKAVIKVNNKYVDEVRTALSLSEIPLRVVGVSGILKKAEEKFIGG